MRTKPVIPNETISAPASNVIEDFLVELTPSGLERVAFTVIREHRERLQQAQDLFEEIDRLQGDDQDEEQEDLRHSYAMAMLHLHAQHDLVSRVIKKLGYVPVVDGQRPVLN